MLGQVVGGKRNGAKRRSITGNVGTAFPGIALGIFLLAV
jgi:hypothetical protein